MASPSLLEEAREVCELRREPQYKGCIKYRTIDRALNISVKQGISYRDKKTYTQEKTRSTSTSSDITQQTERVQGAKNATSAVASGTKTIKTVPVCNKTDRIDDKARTSRQGNTDVGVRGKQINLWQYVDSIHGRRSTTRRSNAVPDNYNGDSIIVGSPKHTTDKRSTPSRQPTQRSSGHHQETEDENGKAVSSS